MPKTITEQQLNDLTDVLGGLVGGRAEPAPEEPAASASQAPASQAPAMPMPQPAPARPKVKPSPYAGPWHKALRGRKPNQPHVPTSALTTHPTRPPKAPVPPHPPSPHALLMGTRPHRPPAAQPFQAAQTPSVKPPVDQGAILQRVHNRAKKDGGDRGTYLAHEVRTRPLDPSIAVQFNAASIDSLEELTRVLNQGYHAEPNEEVDLTHFHDDASPFVALSHPRQSLQQGKVPAVVVGEPYVPLVHELEAAFPGVHFFPAREALVELERTAAQVARPMPTKALGDEPPAAPSAPPKEPAAESPAPEPPTVEQPAAAPPSESTPPPPAEPPGDEPPDDFVIEDLTEPEREPEELDFTNNPAPPAAQPKTFQPIEMNFLRAIKDDPDDKTPREIYADWLQEYGTPSDAALGELMQLQLQRPDDPDARQRVEELEADHPEWFAPWGEYDEMLGTEYQGTDYGGAQFRNGMLHVTWPAESFIEFVRDNGGPERALALVDAVRLYGDVDEVSRVLWGIPTPHGVIEPRPAVRWIGQVSSISLTGVFNANGDFQEDWAEQISKHGKGLRSLDLSHTYFGTADEYEGNPLEGEAGIEAWTAVRTLASSQELNGLVDLNLSYNELSRANIKVLIESEGLRGIRRLDLRGNWVTADEARRLRERFGDAVLLDEPNAP